MGDFEPQGVGALAHGGAGVCDPDRHRRAGLRRAAGARCARLAQHAGDRRDRRGQNGCGFPLRAADGGRWRHRLCVRAARAADDRVFLLADRGVVLSGHHAAGDPSVRRWFAETAWNELGGVDVRGGEHLRRADRGTAGGEALCAAHDELGVVRGDGGRPGKRGGLGAGGLRVDGSGDEISAGGLVHGRAGRLVVCQADDAGNRQAAGGRTGLRGGR